MICLSPCIVIYWDTQTIRLYNTANKTLDSTQQSIHFKTFKSIEPIFSLFSCERNFLKSTRSLSSEPFQPPWVFKSLVILVLCLAQLSGEAHCPETDLVTQCPTQVPRDQHGTHVSPHVAKDKGQASLAGRARPKHTKFKRERKTDNLTGPPGISGEPYARSLLIEKKILKMTVYTARKTVWSRAFPPLLRKLKWQRRSKSVLQTQQPADSVTVFRRAPCGNRLPAKARDNSEWGHCPPLYPRSPLCRDLDQNANPQAFLLSVFNRPPRSCPEVLIFLGAASDDDGVATHYSPRGRHTDGHHFESNLVLELINPLYNILSRGYASGPYLLFMVTPLGQMPDLTGKIPVQGTGVHWCPRR